jgi:hypothetical protein
MYSGSMELECQLCDNSEGLLKSIIIVLVFMVGEDTLKTVIFDNPLNCCKCDESMYDFMNYVVNEHVDAVVGWDRGVIITNTGVFVQIQCKHEIEVEDQTFLN